MKDPSTSSVTTSFSTITFNVCYAGSIWVICTDARILIFDHLPAFYCSLSKQHINILLPRKRSPCCPFFVVVASTFNTQRLPGLFHCGKRYRSARLYLYKSDAPVTNLHLLRSASWK